MAEPAALFSLSAAAVVEDVLREHGCRLSDRDLASRRTGEAGTTARAHHSHDVASFF
jgi:kinesin family protein C2/C3